MHLLSYSLSLSLCVDPNDMYLIVPPHASYFRTGLGCQKRSLQKSLRRLAAFWLSPEEAKPSGSEGTFVGVSSCKVIVAMAKP